MVVYSDILDSSVCACVCLSPHMNVESCRTLTRSQLLEKGLQLVLWLRAEKSTKAFQRGGGRAEEAAHGHIGEATVEECSERQRHHPPVCVRLLPRLLQLNDSSLYSGA